MVSGQDLPSHNREPWVSALDDWVPVEDEAKQAPVEPIAERIIRTQADLQELLAFYKVATAPQRYDRLISFYDTS